MLTDSLIESASAKPSVQRENRGWLIAFTASGFAMGFSSLVPNETVRGFIVGCSGIVLLVAFAKVWRIPGV